jgi:cytoskeletal protein CcmA (bactofilin family)
MSSKNFYGLTGDVTVDGGILNVGNAQLYANTETSNVGIGTTNAEFKLDVHGDANVENLYATYLHGDGSNIENIVSSQWEGSPGDPIYYTSNVGIANTSPVTKTLQVGSNLYVEDAGSNVIHVTGNVYADYFVGDGSQLTGIAASLDQIVDQGNTVSNTIQLVSGQDATSNVGLVTHEGVSISVSNANPTGEYQFGVGSNLLVNVYSSNVLTVGGNVFAQKMTLGSVTVTPAYNLQQITETGPTTNQTLVLSNVTTGLTADANVVVNGNVTAGSVITSGNVNAGNVITSSNIEVGGDLSVTGNVYIDDMRVAEVASNLVTYDSTTGELMDSGGLFSNKLAVVSEQPPIALTGASTVVTNHGTYTIEASSGTVVNLFDKNDSTKWVTDGNYSTTVDTKGTYGGSASLAGHGGEWVKITMPYKTILRHIKIESTNQSVEDIELVGLNADGLTWTPLKTETGLTGPTHTIIVNATTHHRTYGLIVEKTNTTTGRSAVEIEDLKLFTESFSIDGGKVEMASSAVMGGETTMDQHGPHGRGEAKLKKYPEIVFEEGKFDRNDTTNTYTQAGYTVTASTTYSTHRAFKAFNGVPNDFFHWQVGSFSNSDGTYSGGTQSFEGTPGEWLKIEVPNKIKPTSINLYRRDFDGQSPKDFKIYASITGSSWTLLTEQTGIDNWTNAAKLYNFDTGIYYKYFAILVTKITRTNSAGAQTSGTLGELQLYGYEEDPPTGDTSVDTTFTSIMNTPQTTGANVYVDGSLGETFTNRVTGPDATGPSATYDETGKYWELNGTLTSNIAVEANTFLEGDAPHSVSVWFNSSNLEANVSNTCVFSVSDQEKLDSMNLDLQSNTWHNLTYAYQGEGGSRVTYLDGRKVAEDQAEDTFGEYPPFAMTGYSQGGYVVSQGGINYTSGSNALEPWELFDKSYTNSQTSWAPRTSDGTLNYTVVEGSYKRYNTTLGTATRLSGDTEYGEYVKLELPDKIRLNYIVIHPHPGSTDYATKFPAFSNVYGSNDDVKWTEITNWTPNDFTLPVNDSDEKKFIANATKSYKYLALVVTGVGGTTHNETVFNGLQFYGHRENDLVRLPDPTNVLKYPHIVMTGPAQRGYVASATNVDVTLLYPAHSAFDEETGTEWLNLAGRYDASGDHTGGETTQENSNIWTGDWLQIQTPNKIRLTSTKIARQSNAYGEYRSPRQGVILGSNNGTTWNYIHNWSDLVASDWPGGGVYREFTFTTPSDAYYKYYRLIVEKNHVGIYNNHISIGSWQLYGTEENSSIPIQIGGGNIDKVANFRVYDKFVGEDQALEIWDAQKDAFGRAKSSMTLQKGRLGIGTTEPEGRLAVLDEPHNLEEFPPRAMTGYKTYFEGHGVFRVSVSSDISGNYPGWEAFDRKIGAHYSPPSSYAASFWAASSYDSNGIVENGVNLAGIPGHWIKLEMPHYAFINKLILYDREGYIKQAPKEFKIVGSKDDINWDILYEQNTTSFQPFNGTIYNLPHSKSYKYMAVVVYKNYNIPASSAMSIGELRYFGTREQGQSVLHDGQLTLTKSLNVPRIGPALDADDTPRRDRLVVEYNTSTNPTFEGAVRDTSGRGNDGVMYGTAAYNSTSKDLYFDGNSDFIETNLGKEVFKNSSIHTTSLWVKMNHHDTSQQILFSLGQGAGANLGHVNLYYTSNFGLRLSFEQHDYRLGEVVPIGQWVHVAYTYDGTTWQNTTTPTNVNIYINGVKVGITSVYQIGGGGGSALDLSIAQLALGAASTNASGRYYTDADLSQFKLYDTVLTAEEVKRLYDMGRCDEGHHVVNFSKTRVGIGLGDGEVSDALLNVGGVPYGAGVRPIFSAYESDGYTFEALNGVQTDVILGNTFINHNNAYNTSTGVFTVPVTGEYHIFTCCQWRGFSNYDQGVKSGDINFVINGVGWNPTSTTRPVVTQTIRYANERKQLNGSLVIKLNKGDQLKVQCTNNLTGNVGDLSWGAGYGRFAAFLLS